MSSNVGQFVEELTAFGLKVESEALQTKRYVSLQLLNDLVFGTPVGNPDLWKSPAPKGYVGGHARAAWQVTNGSPAEGEVEGVDPNGQSTFSRGAQEIESSDLERTTWLTANLDYIVPIMLEGHSSQAPEGHALAIVERIKAQFP